jgi:hypothetical protein
MNSTSSDLAKTMSESEEVVKRIIDHNPWVSVSKYLFQAKLSLGITGALRGNDSFQVISSNTVHTALCLFGVYYDHYHAVRTNHLSLQEDF